MKHGHPDFFFWSVLKHSLLLYYHPRSTSFYFPLFESHLEVTRHNQHNEMLPRNRKTAHFFPEQVLLMHRFLRIGFFNRSRWKALDLRPYCRPTVIYAVFRTGTIQSSYWPHLCDWNHTIQSYNKFWMNLMLVIFFFQLSNNNWNAMILIIINRFHYKFILLWFDLLGIFLLDYHMSDIDKI